MPGKPSQSPCHGEGVGVRSKKITLNAEGQWRKISIFYILIKQQGAYTKDPVMSLLCCNAVKTEKN